MVDFTKLFEAEAEEAALKNYAARLPVTEVAIDPQTGFQYNRQVLPELKLPVQGMHDYVPGSGDVKPPLQWFPTVQQGMENVNAIREEGFESPRNIKNKLLGTEGAERFQLWPEKMARSGASLAGDVMSGAVPTGVGLRSGDYSDDPRAPQPLANLIERTQDMAGLAAGGSIAATGLKAEGPGALSRGAKALKDRLQEVFAEDARSGTAIGGLRNSNAANRANETMPELLNRQRASEGYEAAIRDSETKKITTGMWHEEVIDKIAKEKGIPREEVNNLVSSPAKGNLVKGYVDHNGKFWTEQQIERRSQSKSAMFRSDDIVGTGLAAVAPRFYSHVENIIDNATMMVRNAEGKRVEVPQQKFNANELMAYLKNKGATAEEIEALGLTDFLQGKKSITKEELINHINENKVELEETVLGKPDTSDWKVEREKRNREWGHQGTYEKFIVKDKNNNILGTVDNASNDADAINKIASQNANPRFAQYQLPGGENYRETLLSLKDNPKKVKRVEEINNEIQNTEKEILTVRKNKTAEDYAAKMKVLSDKKYALAAERLDLEQSFTHDHWPNNKNVIVHNRTNDRFIPDENGPSNQFSRDASSQDLIKKWGYTNEQWKNLSQEQRNEIISKNKNDLVTDKKGLNSLHAEEVQSDWLQKGNSEGFKLPANVKAKLEPEFNKIDEKILKHAEETKDESIVGNPDLKDAIKTAIEKKIITKAEGDLYLRYSASENLGAVPDAPFKSGWSDLMIKRLIRQAAEEGKDAISWTPGQAQIDRYPGLQTHFDRVEYNPKTQEFKAVGKDGAETKKVLNQSQLIDYIGKEATEKLINNPSSKKEVITKKGIAAKSETDKAMEAIEHAIQGKPVPVKENETSHIHTLENADLKVGGEFHKKFYDDIMVNKVNAIAKKFGGRVEEKNIKTGQKIYQVADGEGNVLKQFDKWDDAEKFVKENSRTRQHWKVTDKDQPIWVLRLTPEMKKHALEKGFSMFETGLPLTPISGNPFEQKKHKLIPVAHNPFE